MNTQSIALDVSKQPQTLPVVYLGQGDLNGTTLAASIFDGGQALSLTGHTVRFVMRLPGDDGYYSVAGTVSGNVATFNIDETYACAVAGVTDKAYVEVLTGLTVIASTNRIRVVVLDGAREGVEPSEAHYDEITAAANLANNAATAATTAATGANAANNAATAAASAANSAASAANTAAAEAHDAAEAVVSNVHCFYTTETIGNVEQLVLEYEIVTES